MVRLEKPSAASALPAALCMDEDLSPPQKTIDVWQGLLIAMAIAGFVFAAVQGRAL